MNNPRPESRVTAVEQRMSTVEATLVELSSDQAEELKSIRQEIKSLNEKMDQGFAQAHAYINEYVVSKEDFKRELGQLEARIKDDISGLRSVQAQQDELLREILRRLPEKEG